MGRLDTIADMTGQMNPLEINAQNIGNIIDELNRNSDSLDAISKSLAISNPDKIILPITGNSQTASKSIGSPAPFSFLGFFVRSDLPTLYYNMPYILVHGSPAASLDMVASANLVTSGSNTSLSLDVEISASYLASAPASVTLYYFILNQPANTAGN